MSTNHHTPGQKLGKLELKAVRWQDVIGEVEEGSSGEEATGAGI